jgi:hypothetical protein
MLKTKLLYLERVLISAFLFLVVVIFVANLAGWNALVPVLSVEKVCAQAQPCVQKVQINSQGLSFNVGIKDDERLVRRGDLVRLHSKCELFGRCSMGVIELIFVDSDGVAEGASDA